MFRYKLSLDRQVTSGGRCPLFYALIIFRIFGNFFLIGAILIHAIKNIFTLFHKQSFTASRTFFLRGRIPNGKITFRIFRAAEKDGMIFSEAFYHGRTAFRTGNTDFFTDRLCIFTFREIAASVEFTVTALSDDDITAAKLTFQICFFGFFLFLLHVSGSIERICVFTLGITGTSGKLAESARFHDHSSSAFIADNIGFFHGKLHFVFTDHFL